MDKLYEMIKGGKLPSEMEVMMICEKVSEILTEEENVVKLSSPINVCGDIHGQFYDMMNLFETGGYCHDVKYCFLGDYVDRGSDSLLVILFLFVCKIFYKDRITLLRGNHECREINRVYGFYDECLSYYNFMVFGVINSVFDLLPIAAVIDDAIFCVHGGLTPNVTKISQINKLQRRQDLTVCKIFEELTWGDPDESVLEWELSPRGIGYLFGVNPVYRFNYLNGLKCIVRAHQLAMDGYFYMFEKQVCTVWSAPNYMNRCKNVGAILCLDEHLNHNFKIFKEVQLQEYLFKFDLM